MRALDLIQLIERNAREYRLDTNASLRRNKHMNNEVMKGRENLPQDIIDALLVDFVNYAACLQGIDYALYTKDFEIDRKVRK